MNQFLKLMILIDFLCLFLKHIILNRVDHLKLFLKIILEFSPFLNYRLQTSYKKIMWKYNPLMSHTLAQHYYLLIWISYRYLRKHIRTLCKPVANLKDWLVSYFLVLFNLNSWNLFALNYYGFLSFYLFTEKHTKIK